MASQFVTRREALKLAVLSTLAAPFTGLSQNDSPPSASPARLNLGVATYSFDKEKPPAVVDDLKKLHMDSASLYKSHAPWSSGTPDECRAAVKLFTDAGIAVTSTGVVELTRDEAAARKAFENVRAAGLPMMCGRPHPDALPLMDKLVKEYDVKIGIHNHGPRDLYPTGDAVWAAVQPYDPRIGLCIDVGHAWRAGGDPAAEIRKTRARLYQIHLKDVNGPRGDAKAEAVIIGRGQMDIKGILAALLDIQYQHRVDFEYEERVADKMPGLAESIGYVRGLLAAHG